MENILKALNGRQFGSKYCFERNNEKFIATLDYDGVVDYGWRNLIRVASVDGKYSKVFKFGKGSFKDGEVKYWDKTLDRFVIIKDFTDIVEEIVNWIDFVF